MKCVNWIGMAAIVAVAVAAFLLDRPVVRDTGTFRDTDIRAVLELGRYDDTTRELITGYNYALLKRFAGDFNSTVEISVSPKGESLLDSLKRGVIDLIVLPYHDTLSSSDSVILSIPVDSLTFWATGNQSPARTAELNAWIEDYHAHDAYESFRRPYMRAYNPLRAAARGLKRDFISPYDSLLRAYADSLGWDWRLLAAVVYQESKFHIEAHSVRGARGLMQMMPSTLRSFGVEDPLDPEQSIASGVSYLSRLERMFRRRAANDEELTKFTLAAYNAGEGRLLDCINYAAVAGADSRSWDGILSVIEDMADESILQQDTVKLGIFNAGETVTYVERVLSIYEAYKAVYRP